MMITSSLNTLPLSTHKRQYFPPDEQRQPCRVWVDEQGLILDCCANTQLIFGYGNDVLKERHIGVLIPSLGQVSLLDGGAVNPRLAYRCRCAVPFQVIDSEGRKSRCHLFMNRVTLSAEPALALICVPLLLN